MQETRVQTFGKFNDLIGSPRRRLCCFLDYIVWHNLLVMITHHSWLATIHGLDLGNSHCFLLGIYFVSCHVCIKVAKVLALNIFNFIIKIVPHSFKWPLLLSETIQMGNVIPFFYGLWNQNFQHLVCCDHSFKLAIKIEAWKGKWVGRVFWDSMHFHKCEKV